ncbi:MAG: 4Fe-4S binding protein [Anaerolineae bacterium]|nr:4Fe-4S binding protein [Anaerolineae bacterium]
MKRGSTLKRRTDTELVLERKMVTHHDVLRWDLERCVGCQLGPQVCPKDALTHTGGKVVEGRLGSKLLVDVDPEKCIFCGMCAVMCPVNAISLTLNGEPSIPVQVYEAFPYLTESNEFDRDLFNWDYKDFVIENCPTDVISYDEEADTLVVDDAHCIRCRQCEVASDGAFTVQQPWEGTVVLRREACIEGCFACADICPTRALHINDEGELVLADYYCIKCGACVQICPVEPIIEEHEVTLQSQGVTYTKTLKRVANADELPIWVERWRVRHTPVQSGAWVEALAKLADEKASMVEIERKRAIKRRDLIIALKGGRELQEQEAARREELLKALQGNREARAQ